MSQRPPQERQFTFGDADEVNLRDLGSSLWRGRWLIVAATAIALGIGGAVAWLQPPLFESTALLRIVPEEKGFDLGSSNSSMKLLLGLENTGDLQTSVGILESRRIAEAVVDSLALHVSLRTPATPRDHVLQVLEAPRLARRASLDLRREPDGSYRAAASGLSGPAPDRIVPGESFRIGELTARLNPELRGAPPERIRVRIDPYQKTVQRLQKRLAVAPTGAGSQLVRLRFRHPDSLLVAAVPNLVADRFIEYKNRTSSVEARSVLGFLQDQAEVYRGDLATAEGRLQRFLEQAQIIEPKTQAEEQAKRLAELQAEREALVTERESLAALLRQIESAPRTVDEVSPYRQLVAFPSFLTNTMVQNILHSIITLENARAELLVRRMERNPDVDGKTRRIAELEGQLHQVAVSYLGDRDLRLAALDNTLTGFAGAVAQLPAQEVELRRLSRETVLLEEVYRMIETKLKEEEIRAAAQLANVQIVDQGIVPDEAEFPKPWLYLVLSGMIGLVVGSGAAVLRSRSNPTVNSRADVASMTGLPVLAAIHAPDRPTRARVLGQPDQRAHAGNGRGSRPLWVGAVWPSRRVGGADTQVGTAPLISLVDPAHRLADAYRELRTNVGPIGESGVGAGVLVIAGADRGDDSGVTAANLAIAYAQQGNRVILVDANLRAPLLHTLFDLARDPGLTDVLLGPDAGLEIAHEVSVGHPDASLHVLCAGILRQNPADTVGSAAMQRLVDRLRGQYDRVIITSPSVNMAPDASLLARVADRVLLVVTAGATRRPALLSATEQLQHVRVPVEGVVLNGLA